MKRFMYEEAVRRLDAYAITRKNEGKKGHKSFYRSYRKFKCLLGVYAYVDFPDDATPEQRLAWAWEDADLAFRGYGENLLTGALLQMWTHTHGDEQDRFHEVITAALDAANEATDPSTPRRYLAGVRAKPVRKGGNDFDLPQELPVRGPRLREWAEDEGFDALSLETQMELIEEMDRMTRLVEEPKPEAPKLQLITGGRE